MFAQESQSNGAVSALMCLRCPVPALEFILTLLLGVDGNSAPGPCTDLRSGLVVWKKEENMTDNSFILSQTPVPPAHRPAGQGSGGAGGNLRPPISILQGVPSPRGFNAPFDAQPGSHLCCVPQLRGLAVLWSVFTLPNLQQCPLSHLKGFV